MKKDRRQFMLDAKNFHRWYWMPVTVFVLGLLSIFMLLWNDRVHEDHRINFDIADALMDIHIGAATYHLWLEEAVFGDNTVDIQKVKDDIDLAINLAEALLEGGKSEFGTTLHPVKGLKHRKEVEEIKSLLTKLKMNGLQRIQAPQASGIGSVIDEEFDAVFQEFQDKIRALEITMEKNQIRGHADWRRLFMVALVVWTSIVLFSIAGLWNREARRKTAEMALQKANEQLQTQAEELKRHKEHLLELVSEQTAELTDANRDLQQEISDRKEAEHFLRESENRFRTLVENLPLKIFLKDKNSVYLYCNHNFARDLEIEPEEVFGKTDYDFYQGELAEQHMEEDRRVLKSGRSEEMEERYLRHGQEVVIQKIKLPVKNEREGAGSLLGIVWDITDRVRLESIAEAANMMNNIGYIFAGIRHEIGNPINSLKMTLSVLKNKMNTLPAPTVKRYLEGAMSEISRVEYLLKALKNFNMYETPELQNIQMKSLMDKFLSLVTSDFEEKGIQITSHIQPGADWGYADPRALQQVMINILSNASDALDGRENREIVIDVQPVDGYIRIRVADNGCGMSEEQQKELFKPFRTTKSGGTGLGLVIAKKMLTGMEGAIQIKSEKGEGTMVDILIPRGEE